MDHSTQPVNYLSLYSGGGGLDLGFQLAVPGARAVAYVENDAEACALLVDHMEAELLHPAPVWTDSGTFDGRPFRGAVDFIIGGFPCQPASVAGKRGGTSDSRWLWPHVRRIAEEVMPSAIFLENVRGLLSVGNGSAFEEVLTDLADMGFDARWCVVRASDVGAPHRRERLFILAYCTDKRHDWSGRTRSGRDGLEDGSAELGHSRHSAGRAQLREQRGGTVGDADNAGLEGWRRSFGERGDKLPAWPPGPADTDAWAAVLSQQPDLAPAVADAKRGRSDGREAQPCEQSLRPNDQGRSRKVDRITPPESGVRDLADGLAGQVAGLPRVARLRILGNGVVPQQAAAAYRFLTS